MESTHSYDRYWAKAKPTETGQIDWHPFAYHCLDVAAVAAALWEQSAAVRRALCTALGSRDRPSADIIRAWVLFFTAVHDLGKLHALFQVLAPAAFAQSWPDLAAEAVAKQTEHYDHGLDGFATAQSEIGDWTGAETRQERALFKIWLGAVMGHHGNLPIDDEGYPRGQRTPRTGYATPDIIQHDRRARREWIATAARLFLAPAGLSTADQPPRPGVSGHRLLAGFCSLCDWIGSNTDYFRYRRPGIHPNDYVAEQVSRVRDDRVLLRTGLVAAAKPCAGVTALLRPHEQPRGIQVLIDRLPTTPGLTIVEGPTGSGKTEAALAQAWRLVDTGAADGIIFALPTQATANAMLTRATAFAESAFAGANVVLAHGHRALNREFRQLVDAGRRRNVQGPIEAGAQCAAWLASSRKRVFLGQVGICTVDQVLLSVLPVRHSFVRAFGTGRAVLVIDEVHAYDAYMNGLLTEVLRRHRAAGGSAILLSATLPARIRNHLLGAWGAQSCAEAPYPVIWHAGDATTTANTVPDAHKPKPCTVSTELTKLPEALPDAALIGRIVAAADAGAMVGIVLNTVQDAQRLAAALRDGTEHQVDLFHARFRLCDRQRIEETVVHDYGRDARRGDGRILVATQVIEQSLDLDFDWLITQICPVDLLFQRIGRLHRHAETPRPGGFEQPHCTVLSVADDDYGLHELIYDDARLLWRTEQLVAKGGEIRFPAAYRDWIEHVYAEDPWDDEPDDIYGKHLACRDARNAARQTAQQRTCMSITELRDEDETATSLTRDGEMSLSVLPLLEGARFLDGTPLRGPDELQRAEQAMLNTVPVPHSWAKLLGPADYDDDGRLRLVMEAADAERWKTRDGVFEYSREEGLRKTDREQAPVGSCPR